ncbi:MAG: hypothetical protein RLZZ528_133 [Pseudomonadota bacterium]|jgi:hypothetical protein
MRVSRHTRPDGTRSRASYSDCGAYRYRLTRTWGQGGTLTVLMLNPSTATEAANDPTIARIEARARAAGFAGFTVLNLFALRATRPDDLFRAADPVGPLNDRLIAALARPGRAVLLAWGGDRRAAARALAVWTRLGRAGCRCDCLGQTRTGAPRHPLYLPAATAIRAFRPPDTADLLQIQSSTMP